MGRRHKPPEVSLMVHKKRVDVHRDACDISSSAGYLLSYQTDVCVGMIERLTDCFDDAHTESDESGV